MCLVFPMLAVGLVTICLEMAQSQWSMASQKISEHPIEENDRTLLMQCIARNVMGATSVETGDCSKLRLRSDVPELQPYYTQKANWHWARMARTTYEDYGRIMFLASACLALFWGFTVVLRFIVFGRK
jgi:hypothetical protein